MRIVFIHLSDFHFTKRESSLEHMAKSAVRAVRSSVDKGQLCPVLVLTGDMAFSGKAQEYGPMRVLVDTLLDAAREEFGCDMPIAMVPGNHDVDDPWPEAEDLSEVLSWCDDDKDDFYRQELESSEGFFEFARSYGMDFDTDSGSFVKEVELAEGGEAIFLRLVMLSSSPYSTLGHEQGMHYLPDAAMERIGSDSGPGAMAPYTALLLHHPEHWFDEETRQGLTHELRSSVDFLFTGHEHMENMSVEVADGSSALVKSRAGEFARDDWQRCTFSTLLLDTMRHDVTVRLYQWEPTTSARLYVQKREETIHGVYPKGAALHPLSEFVAMISEADDPFFGNSFLEYFQFPSVKISESIDKRTIERGNALSAPPIGERELFERMAASRVVNVVGGRNSGRTTFLKYLHLGSLERGYSPVLLDGGSAHGRFGNTFARAVRDQFGDSDTTYELYRQQPDARKLLLIDNFHSLSNRERASFFEESLKTAGTVILVTEQPLVLGDDGCAEQALVLGEEMLTMRLGSFTKRSRDALIRRVCSAKGLSEALGDDIALAITHTVTEYHYMFPLNPGFALQYLRYALDKGDTGEVLLRCEKPFGEVYQGNIERILDRWNPIRGKGYGPSDWSKVAIAVLGRVAYAMHATRADALSTEQIVSVIRRHLEEYGIGGIEPRDVFSSLRDSGILTLDVDGRLLFDDSNHHAFFVAYDISRRLDYNVFDGVVDEEARKDVARIIDEVTYGINETILVFLSYLKESAFIPREFSARATSLVADASPATDLSFTKPTGAIDLRMPDESDREAADLAADRLEEERVGEHAPRRGGLYAYDIPDTSTASMSILRATKYVELAGRALSSCFVSTKQDDKEEIVSQMYEAVSRIIGSVSELFVPSFDTVVDDIFDRMSREDTEVPLDRDQVAWMCTGILLGVSVGLIEQIADGMPDDKVIECVCGHQVDSRVQKLLQLALLSNHSDYERFCDLAGRLCVDAYNHGKYADRLAVGFVVSQFIINHPRIPGNLLDKLSDQVFGGKRRDVRNRLMLGRANA